MELANILAAQSVLVCPDSLSKRQLFDLLAKTASVACSHDQAAILAAIVEREDLGSTGLGNGIAIPHGKIKGLRGVTAVFARLETPIDFEAMDDQPVDLVMLLLAPIGAGADHLKALSRVARLLRTESIVQDLRTTDDRRRIHAILTAPVEASNAA
jgi:PTS system nitrogen regulatory IIA component